MKTKEPDLTFYKEHPKKCASNDFWGQVMRTVKGKPVPEEQINLIVEAILNSLELQADDFVIDLCCGNGALSDRVFSQCRGGLGVDFSEVLIKVAEQYFQKPPARTYQLEDVEEFAQMANGLKSYTKALCYGSFMFLPEEKAKGLLTAVYERFSNINLFFIGNLPDKSKIHDFFEPGKYKPGIEDDPGASIGIWRGQDEFHELAKSCGWKEVIFRRMPAEFYATKYRYDAILKR